MSQLNINTGKRGRGVASTSSSSSSGVSSLSSSTDLASLFECPVCFDYVLPPILQCQSGHLVCTNCRPKLSCCPTCRGPLGRQDFLLLLIEIAGIALNMWPIQGTSVIWLWRRWQVMLCSPANTPLVVAQFRWCIQKRQITKMHASSVHTVVPAQAHPVNGRDRWNK